MIRKFTQKEKDVIKAYYYHRKLKFQEKNKNECLDDISYIVRISRKIEYFSACAGTFWFTWKDNVVTTHSEKNWYRMKKVQKLSKKGWGLF